LSHNFVYSISALIIKALFFQIESYCRLSGMPGTLLILLLRLLKHASFFCRQFGRAQAIISQNAIFKM